MPARFPPVIAFLAACALSCLDVSAQTYDEPLRPQFHFTAAKGWLNDPNGLVYYKGEYHLFFQHVPDSTRSVDEKWWGHAVGNDLVHWKQLDEAISPMPRPDGKLAGAWSGTAVVDKANAAGFAKAQDQKPIVAFWTATGIGQCFAYSSDAGRTFTLYPGNPVIPMDPPKKGDWDRDPDVFWYEPGKHWVMIYSITGKGFVFNTSNDLKHWTRQSLLPGMYECPNCFEIPLDGDERNRNWIVWDASSKYFIGRFDGKQFTKGAGPFVLDGSRDYYAAQIWSNAPDGRRIAITWIRDGKFPGMPFNQQMGIPSELKLRTIPGVGPRLTKFPVKEIEQLRYDGGQIENLHLQTGSPNPLSSINGDTFDIEADLQPTDESEFSLHIRGQKLSWSAGKLTLGRASVAAPLQHRHLILRVLIDRTSIEAFADNGAASMTSAFLPSHDPQAGPLSISCTNGALSISSLRVWRMHGIWPGK
jgi:sucrose-6-phosphate hydrolase SacC (GH32 family)